MLIRSRLFYCLEIEIEVNHVTTQIDQIKIVIKERKENGKFKAIHFFLLIFEILKHNGYYRQITHLTHLNPLIIALNLNF